MKLVCLMAIRLYKRFLTRYTPRCPMTPCCSTYAYNAIAQHGASVGLQLAVEYLQNCGKEDRDQEHRVHQQGTAVRPARVEQ